MTLVTLGPHLRLVADLAQLGGDASKAAISANTALENVTHIQVPSHLVDARAPLLVVESRSARDHTQLFRLQATEPSNQLLCQPVAETVIFRISRQIPKGKDQKHYLFSRGRIRSSELFHGENEAVSLTRNRLDKTRALRRISQQFPQLVDRGVQTVLIPNKCVRPKPFAECAPGNQFPGLLQEQFQNLKRLFLKPDPHSVFTNLSEFQVDFKAPETQSRPGGFPLARCGSVPLGCTHDTSCRPCDTWRHIRSGILPRDRCLTIFFSSQHAHL